MERRRTGQNRSFPLDARDRRGESTAALHWSVVGDPRATDREILAWAREHHRVLFTHDLDFGAALASSSANSPSVIQLRANDVAPAAAGRLILGA